MIDPDSARARRAISVLVPLVLVLSGARAAEDEVDAHRRATVPLGETPMIDGTISRHEWSDAMEMPLSGGGTAWLKHDGESLYVALRGEPNGQGNLCVRFGSEVHVLRAAEGLGTAVYEARGTGWSPRSTFGRELRQTGQSKAIQGLRDRFFEAHGWVATNGNTAEPTDMEYRISLGLTGLDEPRIAITYTRFEGQERNTHAWPYDLDDGCNALRVLRGGAPKGIHFDPARWGLLVLE